MLGSAQIEGPTISSWFWRTSTGVFAPNEELSEGDWRCSCRGVGRRLAAIGRSVEFEGDRRSRGRCVFSVFSVFALCNALRAGVVCWPSVHGGEGSEHKVLVSERGDGS